jgi:hypothetical protein
MGALAMNNQLAALLVKDASGLERMVPVDGPVMTIGRGRACSVRIDSTYVSRQHARIELRAGGPTLLDLGSHNGTLLNGLGVSGPMPLCVDDVITVADATITCLEESASDSTRTLRPRSAPNDTLLLNAATHEVRLGARRPSRPLSAQEFALLRLVYEHRDRVCRREELGDAIWGANNWDMNMLHRLVHRLKEKIEPEPAQPRYVQTVPWVGYRLIP